MKQDIAGLIGAVTALRACARMGARRVYSIEAGPLREVDAWMSQFRGFWEHKLDALSTEIARGKRNRRR